jgi:hypothetical protein
VPHVGARKVTREEETLAVVAKVVDVLEKRSIKSALIGAAALAYHGYPRATEDIDIGVLIGELAELQAIGIAIRDSIEGVAVEVVLPDAEDPLGGVVNVTRDDIDLVQVVNLLNPIGMGDHPGRLGVLAATATTTIAGRSIAVVDVPHLIAMKVDRGGPQSHADIVELLARRPDVRIEDVRAVCARFRLDKKFDALVPDIEAARS